LLRVDKYKLFLQFGNKNEKPHIKNIGFKMEIVFAKEMQKQMEK
jgi:hypothetical protein